MEVGYIYLIKNVVNDKIYIGQTTLKKVEQRWEQHIKSLVKNSHSNAYLQNSWNKYNGDCFVFELIEKVEFESKELLLDKLNELESKYIIEFDSSISRNGFNLRAGGNNSPHSEETINKMSLSHLGLLNAFYGKDHSLKTKTKISSSLFGKKDSIKTKINKSNAQIGEKNHFYGKNHSETSKAKIRNSSAGKHTGNKNAFYGKNHSEDTKNAIGKKNKQIFKQKLKEKENLIMEVYFSLLNGESNISLIRRLNVTKGFLYKVKNKLDSYREIIEENLKGEMNND